MLDLEPVNIICHSRRDSNSYLSIIEILNMYELDGLNYKIWTPYEKGNFSKIRSVCYSSVGVRGRINTDFKLDSGNLFRLDILVWELPTTIHPIYIKKNLEIIRTAFSGTVIFVGENIDDDCKYLLDGLDYPIYYLKKIEKDYSNLQLHSSGFRILDDIEDSNTIEDKEGNIQTISSWKTTFIRDRKLGNILGSKK